MEIIETKTYTGVAYKKEKYVRIEHIVPGKFTEIKWRYRYDINKCPAIFKKLEDVYQSLINQPEGGDSAE